MATGTLAPSGKQYFWDVTTGLPLAGGFVYTYVAGTTTPQATYQDSGLTISNTNPITLNSAGYCTIYLPLGVSIKETVVSSAGVTQWTQDNISAVPQTAPALDITGIAGANIAANAICYMSAGDGGLNAGQWYAADSANVYSSVTAYTGFATAAIASGASGTFRQGGALGGFTGLTGGADYYIGTAGAITTTAPSNARLVGRADSTTTTLDVETNPVGGSGLDLLQIEGMS